MRTDTPVRPRQPQTGRTYVEVRAWSDQPYPPGAVVVGYDGKEHSRRAVRWAAHEAARLGVTLVVLHAADFPGMTGEPGPGLLHRDPGALEAAEAVTARGVAEAMAARAELDVLGATEVTTAAKALTAASHDAALVVVGSRGHGHVIRALRGSVASTVAARAHAPVVVARVDAPVLTGPQSA